MPRRAGPHRHRGDGDGNGHHAGLLDRFLQGRRGALARTISMVEDERSGFQAVLDAILRERADRAPARRVGVTGPPGAGKSTLVTALAARFREEDDTVGIVAVDPTSPFSGGALLGDRIRMGDLGTDPGVFIRSMATRSGTGGLAVATGEVVDLLDAFGFDRILVETVGVGQTELEVVGTAETVVVVLVPESGDAVQAMKAGLLEIADIFVVNKADRPGASALVRDLRGALDLRAARNRGRRRDEGRDGRVGEEEGRGEGRDDVGNEEEDEGRRRGGDGADEGAEAGEGERASVSWPIPVIPAVATNGEGIDDLAEALSSHARWLDDSGEGERRALERARSRIRRVVEREVRRRIWADGRIVGMIDAGAEAVGRGQETPYTVSREILETWSRADAPLEP